MMPFDGGAIDLGEAAAETMALALDPFPRGPKRRRRCSGRGDQRRRSEAARRAGGAEGPIGEASVLIGPEARIEIAWADKQRQRRAARRHIVPIGDVKAQLGCACSREFGFDIIAKRLVVRIGDQHQHQILKAGIVPDQEHMICARRQFVDDSRARSWPRRDRSRRSHAGASASP